MSSLKDRIEIIARRDAKEMYNRDLDEKKRAGLLTDENVKIMKLTAQQCPYCFKVYPSLDDMEYCGCRK